MSTARVERLVNLVLALLSTRQYLTAERIRATVPGYAEAASDEAFFRMFERDKVELRELGIPLETGRSSIFDGADGYRIARRDYELGEVDLEPDEAAAVGLAARLWDSPELTGQANSALVKLRAAGVEVDRSAAALVQPRVSTEPAFAPVLTAVREGRPVRFAYRRAGSPERMTRTVEPWGVVSWRGRWYLVGHDRDRQAPRCFRLSRVLGEVVFAGHSGEVERPEGTDLLRMVAGSHEDEDGASVATARLWIADGAAAGIRRKATALGRRELAGAPGDEVSIDVYSTEGAARWIAGYGPDVVVLEPDVLAKAVQQRLEIVAAEGVRP
ncbi:WYL domain-containing protein [Haloechinothrix sp. LS1_15]|uniref:helix-turn-helix transcriptional regulator n=1 Tax=Haloechinothrix sp. LS1_15 TaxID=2652248 RepID=UPI002945B0F6|nr:WYL domain-containing protein [Haloechinothrix sp. LS1_15]MDV6013993.1 WYL domain-containing protein [Haloechinothrix sp. LS1_15]